MKVSVEIIRKMNPCRSRFDENFLVHYPNFNSNLEEFLALDKITYDDKIWVCKRLLNQNQLIHWAVLCAQSVLQIYENIYPNDARIKDCIGYMMNIADFSSLNSTQRENLKELRNDAADAAESAAYAAWYAARSAAYAAESAAYDATYATHAAYAATDAADADGAYDAYDADAKKTQQELNLKFLLIASELN